MSLITQNFSINNDKTKTMKIMLLSTLLISLAITGCQKKEDAFSTQFEKSDALIGNYLDKLDNPTTPKAEQINIICKEYPTEYKTNYMPALLKLQPNVYTETQLLKDLDIALDYYKEKLSVTCE